MKLSTWAKQNKLCYKTAWRMFHNGHLSGKQMPTGTILIDEQTVSQDRYAIYARVSSFDQKADLERQVSRLSEYAAINALLVSEVVKDIGSGLNGHRRNLIRILSKTSCHILVEHRDRLCRFGFEYLEGALLGSGRKIVVVDANEIQNDIVRDLHEIIVSLCARLYGKRAAANKAKKAMEAVQNA